MTKPDDIPQDVWDKARSVIEAELGYHPQVIVARAIMAEREACAKVASEFTAATILPFGTAEENECAGVGQIYASDEIAEAIRNRGATA